ncbi:MAG: ABC transporter permease [Pseudomonadota bacterium]
MTDTLFLALAYIRHTAVRSAVLIVALALILFVPLATRLVLSAAETQLTARAEATPLMIGARGSALDLLMNGLYFTDARPERISMAAADAVWDSGLAIALPLHVQYRARGAPVVGTTLDYFAFRGLEVRDGRGLALLGEAVVGARAAARLGLRPGDTVVTDPETLFDLAGTYPLELSVVGVFAPTGSADDDAVFVDVQTAWVIEGIGHGHDDIVAADMVVREDAAGRVASAALRQFTRITPETIDSFHFHGDPAGFPLSSVIAVPPDARSAAVLPPPPMRWPI